MDTVRFFSFNSLALEMRPSTAYPLPLCVHILIQYPNSKEAMSPEEEERGYSPQVALGNLALQEVPRRLQRRHCRQGQQGQSSVLNENIVSGKRLSQNVRCG